MTPVAWRPYCGPGPAPLDLAGRWNLDPLLLTGLALLAVLLWRASSDRPRQRRAALAGWITLVVGFVSPLCALSSALFSARTVHHVLLVAVAAPLIGARAKNGRGLWPALACHTVVLWAWHWPAAYDGALSNAGVYWTMQFTLLGSAIAFWRAARAATPWPAAGALIAAMTQMSLLGALLTLTPRPLYAPHLATTWAWGLTPLADQQLAGVIMWIPAGTIYLAAALIALRRAFASAVFAPETLRAPVR